MQQNSFVAFCKTTLFFDKNATRKIRLDKQKLLKEKNMQHNGAEAKKFKQDLLDKLYEPYKKCVQCPLGFLGRTHVVFGEGNPDAELMFVGEAPGQDEDIQGRPFVGRSGKLLNKALAIADINREDVFITNVVKCRPPNNRTPLPIEINTCISILLIHQIKIIRPKIICALGSVALTTLLGGKHKITQVRGKTFERENFKIIPIYHPSYVLRSPNQEKIFYEDIKLIKQKLSE